MCKAVSANPQVNSPTDAQVASRTPPKSADEKSHNKVARTVISDVFRRLAAADALKVDAADAAPIVLGNKATRCACFSSGEELHCGGHACQLNDSELVESDPRATNLAHFHCSSKFENLCSASFTKVCKFNTGINGDIFKYQWSRGQESTCVAVKKLRNNTLHDLANAETDEHRIHANPRLTFNMKTEDAMTEIGVLSYLSRQPDLPLYLLKMLGVYSDSESNLTWLVTEFADGGELFDVAAAGGLGETAVQGYMWQLLQAVEYLHEHHIGHRDISLENVLLKDGSVRLMDYGMAVRSHSSSGTPLRYFREVGKAFYRAPECYVPTRENVCLTAQFSSRPGEIVLERVAPNFLCEVRLPRDSVPGATCLADVWGYAAGPADVFALGICMFILAFQCPAWESARLSNPLFAFFYNSERNGLESLLQKWSKQYTLSAEAMEMLSAMLQADPAKRPSPSSCLNNFWFGTMAR